MNNIYVSSLLCITILACAPACKQKKESHKNIEKSIELENTVFEIEEDVEEQKSVKF